MQTSMRSTFTFTESQHVWHTDFSLEINMHERTITMSLDISAYTNIPTDMFNENLHRLQNKLDPGISLKERYQVETLKLNLSRTYLMTIFLSVLFRLIAISCLIFYILCRCKTRNVVRAVSSDVKHQSRIHEVIPAFIRLHSLFLNLEVRRNMRNDSDQYVNDVLNWCYLGLQSINAKLIMDGIQGFPPRTLPSHGLHHRTKQRMYELISYHQIDSVMGRLHSRQKEIQAMFLEPDTLSLLAVP